MVERNLIVINDIDDKLNKYTYAAEDNGFGTCIDSAQAIDSRAKLTRGWFKLIKVIWAFDSRYFASYNVSLIEWIDRTSKAKIIVTLKYPVVKQTAIVLILICI